LNLLPYFSYRRRRGRRRVTFFFRLICVLNPQLIEF
jgi:hypothetical protein